MNVYLTNNKNNKSGGGLEEVYPELYLVYFCILCLVVLAAISTIMCLFPIECGLTLTIFLVISRLLVKRRYLTFFEKEYDLDVFPEEL